MAKKMKQSKGTKQEKNVSVEISKFTIFLTIVAALILFTSLGYGIRSCRGRAVRAQYTIGIVTEIFWQSIKSQFRYIYFVDGIMYTSSSSFYHVDIEPGDTVYVIYEKGDPQNASLKRKEIGWGGKGDPVYSKRVISDTSKSTVGVVSEFYEPGVITYFRYIYSINGVKYTGSSSFHRSLSDIDLNDIVYISYEEDFPDNPVLIKDENGNPIYKKCKDALP